MKALFLVNERSGRRRDFDVADVLIEGSKKARGVAEVTMERVRDAVKLKY